MASDAAGAVHAAVAGGTLTDDSARAILRCIDADGFVDAPNDLLEGIAREVIEAAGVEFRLAKGSNLPATPRETGRTPPETEAPAADRGQKEPVSASSRGSQRPQKRRKRRKRTRPPSQPAPASAGDVAAQATPSRQAKTPDERRIAWAWANQDEAATLLRANGQALATYAAPQVYGPDADPQIVAAVASPDAQLLFHSAHRGHISATELLQAAEKLDVLAHAVERYLPNNRNNPILPAAASGAPAVHVRKDRLPALPAKPGAVQSALPFVPETPEHVLPVLIRGGEAMGNNMVPLRWRFWYEALLSAPFAAYGAEASFAVPLAEIVQFAGWKQWREREHLEPLHDALVGLYDMAINWRNTEWRMVSVTNPPGRGVTLDTPIVFHVHVPPGSRHGPQIHRPTLRQLYRHAPKARALLALSAYWDRYGRGQGGADALATSPRANAWPVLTRESLRLMMFPDKEQRVYRTRAANHAKAMHKAGIIDMVENGGGWRIYRPAR